MTAEANSSEERNEMDKGDKSKGQVAGRVPCEKGRMLIVDDDNAVRRTFQTVLDIQLPNCRIDVAVNGAEAVEFFRSVHHAVLLLDIYLPVMNGLEVFRQIKQVCESQNWEMPSVVFCSGFYPPEAVADIVAENPAHGLLQKPVRNEILVETLKSRLGL